MVCCGWVAWASIAVGAWDRICDLARLVVSAEKSVSSIRERDSVRFVARSVRLLTVASRRFWTAPSVARAVVTVSSAARSEEHTSELQSLMRTSYDVFCLKKKNKDSKR